MNIYLASSNGHKLNEFAEMLCTSSYPLNLYGAEILGGMPIVIETGKTFAANAKIKAEALIDRTPVGAWVLADDSGLEVDLLDGAPGIYSARYAGENASDQDNVNKLIDALQNVKDFPIKARFKCVLVLLKVGGNSHTFEGACEGTISLEPSGASGFGYDPVFIPNGFGKTFADLGREIKQQLSHRAQAVNTLMDFLIKS